MFIHSDALKEPLATDFAEVSLLGTVDPPDMYLEETSRTKHFPALLTHAGRTLAVHGLHVELEVGVRRTHRVTQGAWVLLLTVLATVMLVVEAWLVAAAGETVTLSMSYTVCRHLYSLHQAQR